MAKDLNLNYRSLFTRSAPSATPKKKRPQLSRGLSLKLLAVEKRYGFVAGACVAGFGVVGAGFAVAAGFAAGAAPALTGYA